VSCYRLIEAENPHHAVSRLCRVLGVARAGYHAWASRPPSARTVADQALTEQIRQIHARSRGTYGAPASTPSCASPWACGSVASGWPG
jgi:putative transposase